MSGISVVIPAYNREHLIGDTLRSLLNQTVSAVEIIVVDDGSTDGTAGTAQAAFEKWKVDNIEEKKVPEFRVISQENAGPAKARNTGFAVSTGAFLHFFDSDDLAAPNKHEIQIKALQESGADIAYGPWVKGQISEGKFMPENHVLQQGGLPKGDLVRALLTNWSIVPHACLFRRSIVEKVSGFPEHLFGTEDQMMFLNCLLAGAKVVHYPETLELYRLGDVSKITAVGEGQRRHIRNWAKFLIDADKACLANGINAREWFGFRSRTWESIQDLKSFQIDEQDLFQMLAQIKGESIPDYIYLLMRELERKLLGLKSRLTGSRANTSFKDAPLTKRQKQLINLMGLQVNS